jgi:glucan biosynthesis protein C
MRKIVSRKSLPSITAPPSVFKLPSTTLAGKNEQVETLRGIAIILVVFGHMIGYTETGGMRVSDDSVFRYLYYSLEYFRLPLFTVISGWVYANKPVKPTAQSSFVKGKLRRLILPMFVVSSLLFLSRMIVPGTNTTPEISDFARNLVFPYDVYWYLFSLFLIFLLIALLDRKAFFQKFDGWAITVLCSFVFLFISENFLDPVPNVLSFKGAAYLFPFFLIGTGIHRYKNLLLAEKMTPLILIILIGGIAAQQFIWFNAYPQPEKHSVLGMTIGICAVLLLFRLKFKNSFLGWVGNYAYAIFLFHVFFTGGSRIALLKAGVENQWVILVAGVVCAILFSIILEILIRKSAFLRFYLLGLKKHEKK